MQTIQQAIIQFLGFILLWQAAFNISNAAITVFLKAFKHFILILGQAFGCASESSIADGIPLSYETVHRRLNIDKSTHLDYVVCPKCFSVYEQPDCIIVRANGDTDSRTCCHTPTPNHPHRSRRNACGCLLMKKQKSKHGIVLTPRKVFPYRSVIKSLSIILSKPGMVDLCEQWRHRGLNRDRINEHQFLGDVYDGRIWKKFNSDEYNNFLSTPHSFLLTLNVDWFQPFQRGTCYSTGAIYLTVQNLPRQERYRAENLILVGILPGPSEPNLIMNSYLTPMVEELLQLWQGVIVPIQTLHGQINIRLRAALSCVACDIPASKKVSGFLHHSATFGCTKCYKKFAHSKSDSGGILTDYSGYDRENWTERTCAEHRQKAKELLKEKTPTALQNAESRIGLRYSILLSLPYFDPVKFTIIDPMHNLFLGTGKHTFEVWMDVGVITKKHLKHFQDIVEKFVVPTDVGRIPSSIGSGIGGFTANQWSNWITIFSPIALKGTLSNEHLECWLMFVRACALLKPRMIRVCDIESADILLLRFCKQFQQLYGSSACTPNMHLHAHLKECLLDFGPPHAFWCYPFERYNGILGQYHTNRRSIESQLMKKFVHSQAYVNGSIVSTEFSEYLPGRDRKKQEEYHPNNCNLSLVSTMPIHLINSFALDKKSIYKPLKPFKVKALSSENCQRLKVMYEQLYPSKTIAHISHLYHQYGRISVEEEVIGSELPGPNNHSSATIAAYWPCSGNSLIGIDYTQRRVGKIQYFLLHSIEFISHSRMEKQLHLFCYVQWKKPHAHSNFFGQSAVVCTDDYEPPSPCSFIPAQRILGKCAHVVLPVDFESLEETVFIACPIPLKYTF